MRTTDLFLSKTKLLTVQPEISPGDHGFLMFNDAGTEVEVSELLYSLMLVLKPKLVLETGTHRGVSSTYMAQALEDNKQEGKIITFEIEQQHIQASKRLWQDTGLSHRIESRCEPSLNARFPADTQFDVLFLDSEPQLRFDEFIKFWPMLKPGGFIIIHDLHPNLGHHGQVFHGELDWPWGDFRLKLGSYIKNFDVQMVSFPTPRGCTMFQKNHDNNAANGFLKNTLV